MLLVARPGVNYRQQNPNSV